MYDMYNLSCVCVIAFLALLSRYGLAQPFSGEIRLFSFVFFRSYCLDSHGSPRSIHVLSVTKITTP